MSARIDPRWTPGLLPDPDDAAQAVLVARACLEAAQAAYHDHCGGHAQVTAAEQDLVVALGDRLRAGYLDDLVDPGRECWWCSDRHVLGAPTGACPIRLVTVAELSQRRRRHRWVLS
ncbi:MAG: hypothetical protein R6T85_06320 [Egibacteraceae bacterium]